jgi:hypothetical protein
MNEKTGIFYPMTHMTNVAYDQENITMKKEIIILSHCR